MTSVRPMTDEEIGDPVGDLDLRELKSKIKIVAEEEDGADEVVEMLLGDGEAAVVITTSWTNKLDEAADRAEEVGNEMRHLAVILRERAERLRRPAPATDHPEMGVAPTR